MKCHCEVMKSYCELIKLYVVEYSGCSGLTKCPQSVTHYIMNSIINCCCKTSQAMNLILNYFLVILLSVPSFFALYCMYMYNLYIICKFFCFCHFNKASNISISYQLVLLTSCLSSPSENSGIPWALILLVVVKKELKF